MTDFHRKKSALEEKLKISGQTISQRLALFNIDSADYPSMQRYTDASAEAGDPFIDRFIGDLSSRVSGFETLIEKIEKKRLKKLVAVYFRDMVLGRYTPQYFQRRLEIGTVHGKLGISPEKFTAAFSLLLECFLDWAAESSMSGPLPMAATAHLIKASLFDLSFILEIFADSDHQTIEHMAKHDGLTGLPNHNMLLQTIDERLPKCTEANPLAVLFIGLNHFKAVNETLGHAVGDLILKEVAERLIETCPEDGMVSRLGGDIFVLLAPFGRELDAHSLVQAVLDALDRPLKMEGFSVDVTATVGMGIANDSAAAATDLMSQADMALYHAKHRQLTKTTFTTQMKRYSVGQLGIGTELRRAIDQDELVLFYQPKIELAGNTVVGAEALIRWIHPIRGFMPPGLFIPAAEQSVLIHPVTDWVLNAAVSQAADWQKRGYDLTVSVNLSAPNLQNYELPSFLKQLLSTHGLAPEKLMLEITESGLMADPQRALDTVGRLRDIGVKLSIDDFGTGYSSLAYLKNLPVDEVKIDQVFVFGMAGDEKDERIVRTAVQLGKGLKLSVAAEGVEDANTQNKLLAIGCDTAQGFFISKPIPSFELETWLDERVPPLKSEAKGTSVLNLDGDNDT